MATELGVDGDVHANVKEYYGSRLGSSCDLQTSAASCGFNCRPASKGIVDALDLVHPEVIKRFYGCGLPVPAKLAGCKVLDLGSGSGRDCFALSKLVGPDGHVTGIDMTHELIKTSQEYIKYHQQKCGYEKPNVSFFQGYMEKLDEAGIASDSMDIVVSNCVFCLCPDKKAVLLEAYSVLKDGGELYFSDMYANKVIPEQLKQDPILWVEGMGGSLFWQDFISLAKEVGFSTPNLVSASHIVVHNCELKAKAGDISYASGTYRVFKLPRKTILSKALVTYMGTMADFPDEFEFDSSYHFQKDSPMEVDGEIAAILQNSRFSSDFEIQILSEQGQSSNLTQQCCHLNPFLLADKRGSSVKQCSKRPNQKTAEADG